MDNVVIEGKCEISENVQIEPFVRIRNSKIGDNCRIESFSFIYGANIGKNVKILGNVFIPQGVVIRDNCVICPGVTFINTKYPGRGEDPFDYEIRESRTTDGDNYTEVGEGTVIGANSVIGAGIKIGERSFIGMGSVVTRNVPEFTLVYGINAVIRKSQGKYWLNWDTKIIDLLEKDWNSNLRERRTLHRVLKELREKNSNLKTFLSAGCGTLVSYPFIKEYGYTYSGVDVTEEMIQRAKQKFPEANIWVQDILELSEEKQYDVVLNSEVIYHVPDIPKFVDALWRVTGKVLVIKAAYMWTKPSRPDFDSRNFYNWKINVDELVSLLENLLPLPKKVEVVEVDDDEKTTPEFSAKQIFVVWKGEY